MKKFLFAALSLLLLASCSDDPIKGTSDPSGQISEDNAPGVYIGVNFQMPGMGGSRSTTDEPKDDQSTSNDGTEIGKEYENNVNEVLLILARKADYGFIGAAKVQSDYIYKHSGNTTGTPGAYHASAKFEKSKLERYYADTENFDTEIAVFIVVNPNGGLQTYFEGLGDNAYGDLNWVNETWKSESSTEGSIWSSANGGHFLMTNSRIALRKIPADYKTWEVFSKRETPFNLSESNDVSSFEPESDVDNSTASRGAVNVQRACARIDFKDGSEHQDNTYDAIYLQTKEGKDSKHALIAIELQRLSLVNMNNKFYYFERVSDNGLPLPENDIKGICQPEKPWWLSIPSGNNTPLYYPTGGNYVVDAWAQQKYDLIGVGSYESKLENFAFSDYFEYPLYEDGGSINSANLGSQTRWSSSEISDILDNELDNYHANDYDSTDPGEYHIWRYVTENIIPYTANPYPYYQPTALTTGIVFRGKMKAYDLPQEGEEGYDLLSASERERYQNVVDAINATGLKVGQGDEADITEENYMWKNPIIYMYAKKLYATWNDVCSAAIEGSLTIKKENGDFVPDWNRNNSFYRAVFGTADLNLTGCVIVYNIEKDSYNVYIPGIDTDYPTSEYQGQDNKRVYAIFKDWNVSETDPNAILGCDPASANYLWRQWVVVDKKAADKASAFKAAATGSEITLYQRSNEDGMYGYYCYYYYWNRHNDNNRDGVMGPMEFCTVRNNVYKLSVTKISNPGHPRMDENDPYTPKPYDPDESSNVYITVDSKVIPWVVRVNDIQF